MTTNLKAGPRIGSYVGSKIFASLVPNAPPLVIQSRRDGASVSDSSTPFNFSLPSLPTNGNLLIITFSTFQTRNENMPAGWLLLSAGGISPRGSIWYKIANNEPASYQGYWNGATSAIYVMLEIDNIDPANPTNFIEQSGASAVISFTLLAAGHTTPANSLYISFAYCQTNKASNVNNDFTLTFGLSSNWSVNPHAREFITSNFIQNVTCTWSNASERKRFKIIRINGNI